jgi:GNAT superfamily N-acetyltransferase
MKILVLPVEIDISEATPRDAPEIAEIHLAARLAAMPYLRRAFTDDTTRCWFAGVVGVQRLAWWVARHGDEIVGYMLLDGEEVGHLYVQPARQGNGVGTQLLALAKKMSPARLTLSVFRRNTNARAFYEARGFIAIGSTDGRNEENEPDVQYVWESSHRG